MRNLLPGAAVLTTILLGTLASSTALALTVPTDLDFIDAPTHNPLCTESQEPLLASAHVDFLFHSDSTGSDMHYFISSNAHGTAVGPSGNEYVLSSSGHGSFTSPTEVLENGDLVFVIDVVLRLISLGTDPTEFVYGPAELVFNSAGEVVSIFLLETTRYTCLH